VNEENEKPNVVPVEFTGTELPTSKDPVSSL
jgi:hypothetical protein